MTQNKPNILLITLASVFFVYILFLLFQFTNKTIGPVNQQVVPTPEIASTDWKLFTSAAWKFSFKYPQAWTISTFQKPDVDILPPNSTKLSEGGINISLEMNHDKPVIPQSFKDYSILPPNQFDGATWAIKNNQTGEILFWKDTVQVFASPIFNDIVTEKIFNEILSTIKFTNPQTTNILNTKTFLYSKNNFNFSFLYPTNFNSAAKTVESWLSPTDKTIVEISSEFTQTNSQDQKILVLNIIKDGGTLDSFVNKLIQSESAVNFISGQINSKIWNGTYKNYPAKYLSFANNGYIYSFGLVNYTSNSDIDILKQVFLSFKFNQLSKPTCGRCPQLMPPAPDFCQGGTIKQTINDDCGCNRSPECIK